MASTSFGLLALPNEIKSNVVSCLVGKDAANLRLCARAWRDAAAEGLFNTFLKSVYPEAVKGTVYRGVLVIRPYTTFRSVADKLRDWPWLGKQIVEVQIHLPDKDLRMLVQFAREYARTGKQFTSFSRLKDLVDSSISPRLDTASLTETLSSLPFLENLCIFSEKCPWPETERELCAFWKHSMGPRNSLAPVGTFSGFQDERIASAHYFDIINTLKNSTVSIKRLLLERVPLTTFNIPGSGMQIYERSDSAARYFDGKLGGIRHVHIKIVHSTISTFPAASWLGEAASSLFDFLGHMEDLNSVSLHWQNRDTILPIISDPTWQNDYLTTWGILQDKFFAKTWRGLHTLRLQGFRSPDRRIAQFALKHSTTLRRLTLVGCFLGHSSGDGKLTSWKDGYKDNCREMLEQFRDQATLDGIVLCFTTEEYGDFYPLWITNTWTEDLQDDDTDLLNKFLHGQSAWPMPKDSPSLL